MNGKYLLLLLLGLTSVNSFAIDFSKPKYDENIIAGSNYTLEWEAITDATYDLYYSLDSGKTYNIIEENITGNQYVWSVPEFNISSISLLCSATVFTPPKLLYKENLNSGRVNSICYEDGGSRVLTTTFDNNIFIYSETFEQQYVFSFPTLGTVFDAKFIGKDSVLFSAGGQLYLFDISDGIEKEFAKNAFSPDENIEKVAFAKSRSEISAASYDGTFKVFDLATAAEKKSFSSAGGHEFYSLRYSMDETILAAGDKSGRVYIYNFDNDELRELPPVINPKFTWNIARAIDISKDNTEISVAYADGTFARYNAYSLEVIEEIPAHTGQIRAIEYHPHKNYLLTASMDKTFAQWEDGSSLHDAIDCSQTIVDAGYSETGDTIAISTYQGEIQFWSNFDRSVDTAKTAFNLKYLLEISLPEYTVSLNDRIAITPQLSYTHKNQQPLEAIDSLVIYYNFPAKSLYPIQDLNIERQSDSFTFVQTMSLDALSESHHIVIYNALARKASLEIDSVLTGNSMLQVKINGGSVEVLDDCLYDFSTSLNVGKAQLSASPNPAQDLVSIDCKLPENQVHDYILYDIRGQAVPGLSGKIDYLTADKKINISKLSNGLYTFEIISKSGHKYNTQILIQK